MWVAAEQPLIVHPDWKTAFDQVPSQLARYAPAIRRNSRADTFPFERALSQLEQWLDRSRGNAPILTARSTRLNEAELALGAIRCARLARVLQLTQNVRNFERQAVTLRHLNPFDRDDGIADSWNRLLEFEVAALISLLPIPVEFNEPDVLSVDGDGNRLGIACKRPQRAGTIVRNLDDGMEQVTRHRCGGIVVVGLDLLLDRALVAENHAPAQVTIKKHLEAVARGDIERIRQRLSGAQPNEGAFAGSIYGAMLFATCPTFRGRHSSGHDVLLNHHGTRNISNPSMARSIRVVVWLSEVFRAGEARLWLEPSSTNA